MSPTIAASPISDCVIADNVPEWRQAVQRVLAQDCFPDLNLRFHAAADGIEAAKLVTSLGAASTLLVTDLHMAAAERKPGQNGDELLKVLATTALPRLAIVSGTVSNDAKRELNEGVIGLTFVEKDAFTPHAAGTARHSVAIQKIRGAALGDPPAPSAEQLERLSEIADRHIAPDGAAVLIDSAKGRAAAIASRYPQTSGDPRFSFLDIHGLFGGDSLSKLHDYKNDLALKLGALAEDGNVPRELLAETALFQGWLNQSYAALRNQPKVANIGATVSGLVEQLKPFVGDRLQFRSYTEDLVTVMPQESATTLVCGLIHNALTHGSGPVRIRAEKDRLLIMNEVPEGRELPFSISYGEIRGEIPQHSTVASGSGTGIQTLATLALQNQNLRFDMWQDRNIVYSELRFWHDFDAGALPKHGSLKAETISVSLARPNIAFICHDNQPSMTFSALLETPIDGVIYKPLQFPKNFDLGGRSGPTEETIDEKLTEHASVLQNASLLLIHTYPSAFRTLLPKLHERHPDLYIFPVSSEPQHWYNHTAGEFERRAKDDLPQNLLLIDDVRRLIKPSDPAPIDEVAMSMYFNRIDQPVWETLLLIVERLQAEKAAQ